MSSTTKSSPGGSGYSGTPLARKLGIKPGFRVKTVGAPPHYLDLLDPLPEGVRVSSRLRGTVDLWHIFAVSPARLAPILDRARVAIPQNGTIWVSWPKRSSGVATTLDGDGIRVAAFERQLVDVKVCAVDEVWSGLKLVIRKDHRQ